MFPQNYSDGLSACRGLPHVAGRYLRNGDSGPTLRNFTVQANTVTSVELTVQVTQSDVVENKGIHVTSAQPITVYGMNQRVFTSDAYLALPVDGLGKDHYVLTYNNLNADNATQVGVVATENGTTVTITPSATTGTRLAGVPYSVDLQPGQTYLLRTELPNTAGDLTGTRVVRISRLRSSAVTKLPRFPSKQVAVLITCLSNCRRRMCGASDLRPYQSPPGPRAISLELWRQKTTPKSIWTAV